jgi:uncharacterized protein (TIGR02677 family)
LPTLDLPDEETLNGAERREVATQVQSYPQEKTGTTVPTTTFAPFGPISLFNYLTTFSEHIDWCRSIMRIFLQCSREYCYQLTAQDVLEGIRETYDPTYSLEACKADLERLVGWGNLTTLHDTSRVTSIADFRSPILLYQARPEALKIEVFLVEHVRMGASEGGLHQGDLPRLWEALQQLHLWLQDERSAYNPERSLEIAERWRDAFTIWEKVTNDAAQYLGSMNRAAQQTVNLETFLAYKSAVVTYVQSFAQQLVQHSNNVRALFVEWNQTGKKTLLLDIVTSSPPAIQQLAESRHTQQLWHEDVQRQIEALERWFTRGNNVEMFRKAAHDAVEKVVHRAHTLAAAMRPHTDYVSMLHGLASQLLYVDELETARQLFVTAFANTLPIHLSEGFTGSPVVADASVRRQTWEAPPTVTRTIRPIYKGSVERIVEPLMHQNEEMLHSLRAEYETQLNAYHQQFEQLFQMPMLDLCTMQEITPAERTLLTEILDACLISPVFEYYAPDGTTVKLLNHEEQRYISLHSNDGILVLPGYRLHCQTPFPVVASDTE